MTTLALFLALISIVASLSVTSRSWNSGDVVPGQYACTGASYNISFPPGKSINPPLSWSFAPRGVRSWVLTMDDPDAVDIPVVGFSVLHWVVFDIPARITSVADAVSRTPKVPGKEVFNNVTGVTGYYGMCPPTPRHHLYRWTIFGRSVLNTTIPDDISNGNALHLHGYLLSDGNTLAVGQMMGVFPKLP